jgi:hypothetical protein
MKLILFLLIITSCTTLRINEYTLTIPQLQKCWNKQDLTCIEKYFGKPHERTKEFITYSSDGNPTLKVFINGGKIVSIYYWILDPKYANSTSIKNLLSADDWKIEKIPETNPHVVNLAEANFSNNLGVSFLTYKLDSEKKVRIIYWGMDYMKMEF